MSISPSHTPKQLSSMEFTTLLKATGCVIVKVESKLHPVSSVTVIVTSPAPRLLSTAPVPPLVQLY